MYCQACGAPNADGAKFCNMCGGRIATPGAPGGPLAPHSSPNAAGGVRQSTVAQGAMYQQTPRQHIDPIAPTVQQQQEQRLPAPMQAYAQREDTPYGASPFGPTSSMLGVSLAGIGVRSRGRTWIGIVFIALLLVAAGALGAWLLMRNSEPPATSEGAARAEDPFVIGTPLPTGRDVPAADFASGKDTPPLPAESEAAKHAPSAPHAAKTGTKASGDVTKQESHGSREKVRGSQAASKTSSSASNGNEPSPQPTSPTASGSATAPTNPNPPVEGEANPQGQGDLEEQDPADALYGARVRYVVGRYYAARAQTCFDRATRNQPGLRGTVVIGLDIAADGQVTHGSVVRNTTGDESLGGCLAAQVQSWRLPPPPGGALAMQMPFSR